MHDRRTIYLPQHHTHEVAGPNLPDALKHDQFPGFRDSRDRPGTIAESRSKLNPHRYVNEDIEATYPVPQYSASVPIQRIRYDTFGGPVKVDVVPVTTTPMTPRTAEAFLELLASDPTHPFVRTHVGPGVDLNGSDSYFAVEGPALAVPLSRMSIGANARRRKDYVAPKPDGREVDLPVHVTNLRGLSADDFLSAARRHESLSPNEIVLRYPNLSDLKGVRHMVEGGQIEGSPVAMLKLVDNGRTVGYFRTAEEAQVALSAALEGVTYEGTPALGMDRFMYGLRREFEVRACLLADGVEVEPEVHTTLVEASAVVRAEVATVPRARSGEVAGWMLGWHSVNWHRDGDWLTQYLEDGVVVDEHLSPELPGRFR